MLIHVTFGDFTKTYIDYLETYCNHNHYLSNPNPCPYTNPNPILTLPYPIP